MAVGAVPFRSDIPILAVFQERIALPYLRGLLAPDPLEKVCCT